MIPHRCCSCDAKALKPVSAFLAKYIPALKKDFQLTLTFRARRVHDAKIHLMDISGKSVETTLAELNAEDKPPLSIRSMWRQMIAKHLFAEECPILQVSPGYVIGMRPYADTSWAIHGLNMQLEAKIGEYEIEGYDVFSPMNAVEELALGLPHADLYLNWLGAYASDIASGTTQPFILVRTSDFVDALIQESARLGIDAERVGEANLTIRFSTSDLHIELNLARVLLRIIHAGLGFAGDCRVLRKGTQRHPSRGPKPNPLDSKSLTHAVGVNSRRHHHEDDRCKRTPGIML